MRLRFLPNVLTFSRLVLGLAFPWLLADWRLAAIAAAAITDFLDGQLARLLGAESVTGRLLDPVADKTFVLILLGTLIAEGAVHPLWALAVAARDLTVLAGVMAVLLRRRWGAYRRMSPTWLGKVTTAAQFALLIVLVVRGGAWIWLLALTAALSLAAAIANARGFLTMSREPRSGSGL